MHPLRSWIAIVLVVVSLSSLSAAESFLYVANNASFNVGVYDAAHTLIATISTGVHPFAITVSPDGSRAYVTNDTSQSLTVIDTATNAIVATVSLGGSVSPRGVAVSPDGTRVYVAQGNGVLRVIDTATNVIVAQPFLGNSPTFLSGVAVSWDGSRIWITDQLKNEAMVLDATSYAILAHIPLLTRPYLVVLSADGTRAYVSNLHSSRVSVIDTATYAVLTHIVVSAFPRGMVITPDGSRMFVACWGNSTVNVLDLATNTKITQIPVLSAFWPAITADGSRVYVTAFGGNTVDVIDTATLTVVDAIPVGSNPIGIALVPPPSEPTIPDLVDGVEALVADGSLTKGQGTSLTKKLRDAEQQLQLASASGDDTKKTVHLLRAFINEVEALLRGGVLEPSEGQPLIDMAGQIIAALTS